MSLDAEPWKKKRNGNTRRYIFDVSYTVISLNDNIDKIRAFYTGLLDVGHNARASSYCGSRWYTAVRAAVIGVRHRARTFVHQSAIRSSVPTFQRPLWRIWNDNWIWCRTTDVSAGNRRSMNTTGTHTYGFSITI